ncbi:FecR domain-containing protein [Piscinibacter sakaiensis]|uniref:FecR domain-containing protein n=1 Tax=Piscinibacter sakaiensis TaxID=1547922 RepID=UPI003728A6BA
MVKAASVRAGVRGVAAGAGHGTARARGCAGRDRGHGGAGGDPEARGQPPAAGREWPYRIAAGDTLIGLAALYLQRPGDWPQVQRLNGIADPRRLVPGSVLRLPFDWLRRDAAVAEVVHVAGAVDLLRDGAPPQALAAGPGGAASLRFVDGSRLLVVPGSRVTLERLLVYGRSGITDTGVRVDRGGADTRVEPNASRTPAFEVRTPAIHLGVRGTDFRVGVEDGGAAPPQWEPPQLSPAHLLLRWRASAPGQGVDLQLARDPGFEQRLAEQRHWGGQLQLPRPAAGTVYARLRSVLGDSAVGDFGPPLTVEVPAVPWWDSLWLPRGP